jgi:catechol 2,3-dioxygenase-like lactoylglutathione lyase family enzyme
MSRPALVPELYVSDLPASIAFYVDLLGFRLEYERPEDRFAALGLGSALVMLEEAPSLKRATPEDFRRGQWRTADLERPFGRGLNLEIEVHDIQTIDSRISDRRYPLLLGLHDRSYRVGEERRLVRQLLVADPDGYLIRLSQVVSPGERAGRAR